MVRSENFDRNLTCLIENKGEESFLAVRSKDVVVTNDGKHYCSDTVRSDSGLILNSCDRQAHIHI